MPRRHPVPDDLSPKEFRDALVDNGFAYLGRTLDLYVDIHNRRLGTLAPVKCGQATNRRATFEALLAARRGAEAAKAAETVERRRMEAAAAAIAPRALTPCRVDLTGAVAIAQLADDYLTRLASAGCVDFKDLIQMGWSAAQLREHADAARAVADRKAVPA